LPPELFKEDPLPGLDHWRTRNYLKRYGEGEGLAWVQRALKRAEPLASFIREEIEKNGLPPEIFYLPVIESAYRSAATSHAGAAGMWQFIPATGTLFGLTIDQWVDQRRDFYQATLSAMKTLKYNYSRTGDWLLALAAYNAGLGRIQRITAQENSRDYWELVDRGALPQETANYIPKLLAVNHIATNKRLYNLEINWSTQPDWDVIPMNRAVDLRILSERAGTSYEALKALNQELHFQITPPAARSYSLKVPLADKERIESILASSPDLVPFSLYKIKSGDTLSEIADHYGISLGMIYTYNRGLNPNRLQLGQKILIPNLKNRPAYTGRTRKASFQPVEGANYTVKEGDSLWTIARNHGTTVERLQELNGLSSSSLIRAGWQIKVPLDKEG